MSAVLGGFSRWSQGRNPEKNQRWRMFYMWYRQGEYGIAWKTLICWGGGDGGNGGGGLCMVLLFYGFAFAVTGRTRSLRFCRRNLAGSYRRMISITLVLGIARRVVRRY
ncbi:hypothetical protein MAPG_05227 [Magnaporthiopsis poae ATCC 64411]|uniref:Uncharacterized protein n=1 Tax=Magnaporthiopsis poae (strain ATCC 64411 / 73-15) TaxID=644358 RepID=A0A0C4DYU8_MAGP6|nr:hypothetical protein MAPG_05227 [Magnaporthiopsis poae ATCC 64411]